MNAIPQDELITGSDLYIVAKLELAIEHMIFLHTNKGGIFVRLGIAVPLSQYNFLGFILLLTGQII